MKNNWLDELKLMSFEQSQRDSLGGGNLWSISVPLSPKRYVI